MATLIYNVPYTPTVEDSFSLITRIPPIVVCPPINVPPFLGADIADGWNGNRCGSDSCYFALWKRGDIIPIQVALDDVVNADIENPTVGFYDSTSGASAGTDFYVKIEVYDYDCTTVLFDQADAVCSDYWVAWSDRVGSIQTAFLDTSTLALTQEIFRVKITSYTSAGLVSQETWSEPFALAACQYPYTVRMEGYHTIEDCLQRDYRVPTNFFTNLNVGSYSPTAYYTGWRFAGELINIGTNQEREVNDNDRVLSNKVRTVYQLALRKIPPYAKEILSAIITAPTVYADADDGRGLNIYEEFTDIQKNIDGGTRMFLPRLECVQICEIDGFSCDD